MLKTENNRLHKQEVVFFQRLLYFIELNFVFQFFTCYCLSKIRQAILLNSVCYLCALKLSKAILLFNIIAVSLICGKASAIDNTRNICIVSASIENKTQGEVKDKTASFNQAVSKERFSLETPAQPSVTPRIEKRNSFNGLFLSFFYFNRTGFFDQFIDTFQLQVVPHALKIIYPHHYFWQFLLFLSRLQFVSVAFTGNLIHLI